MMIGVVTVPLVLALGILSGWLAGSGNRNAWFRALRKPWFMPPSWAFPVVWTCLYVAMGVAVARIAALPAAAPGRRLALTLFVVQLALNLLWSPVFFARRRADRALLVILALDAAAAATVGAFRPLDATAAALMLPYLLWLALATALNLAILRLNPRLAKQRR